MLRKVWSWLFTRPGISASPWRVILWWELRRIPYNLIVGAAGIVSLLLFFLFITSSGELKPGEDAVEPMALFIAPFAINFFYTAGWVVELGVRRVWRDENIGPLLLKTGLIFSLLVVFIPSAVWGIIRLLQLLGVRL